MPENSDREAWTDVLAGPRPRQTEWTATLKHDGSSVRVKYVGMVLGVAGPWQIIDPGGERDGKLVSDWNIAHMVRA